MKASDAQAAQFAREEVRRIGDTRQFDAAPRFVRSFEQHRRRAACRELPLVVDLQSQLDRIATLIRLAVGRELDAACSVEALRSTEKSQRLNPVPRVNSLAVSKTPAPQFVGRMKQDFAGSETLQRDDRQSACGGFLAASLRMFQQHSRPGSQSGRFAQPEQTGQRSPHIARSVAAGRSTVAQQIVQLQMPK